MFIVGSIASMNCFEMFYLPTIPHLTTAIRTNLFQVPQLHNIDVDATRHVRSAVAQKQPFLADPDQPMSRLTSLRVSHLGHK